VPNEVILQRLAGIRQSLMGAHQSGAQMSAASRGGEREAFIGSFLANVLPPVFRFGTGDATDAAGHRSGQLDVGVEFPFSPSLPSAGGSTRLYLAESVAAVIEVKSNIAAQWKEAVHTAEQLAPLRRTFGGTMFMGNTYRPTNRIPLFVAGYTGWKTIETVEKNLAQSPQITGALVIDAGLFACSAGYGGMRVTGSPWSLWGLIVALHEITNQLQAASTDPVRYAV
jgi:hypothetical protein